MPPLGTLRYSGPCAVKRPTATGDSIKPRGRGPRCNLDELQLGQRVPNVKVVVWIHLLNN